MISRYFFPKFTEDARVSILSLIPIGNGLIGRVHEVRTVVIAALLVLSGSMPGWAQSASDRIDVRPDRIVVEPVQAAPEGLDRAWPDAWVRAYQRRVKAFARHYTDRLGARTTKEYEKWGYPNTMYGYLLGDREKALEVLMAPDADTADHAWTLGHDFYWCFNLKGQVLKYFFFGEALAPEYRTEMKKAAEIWTSQDPRPSLELVNSLDSPYPKARAYARTLLKRMWRSPSELRKMAEQAESEGHPNKKKFAKYLRSVVDEMPDDRPETVAEWRAWWKHIADGDWRVFEEYERRVNPNPHPKYGRGTGPVGSEWEPEVRGMRVDPRNTDNLRAMRDVAVYLFAEETGNEKVRQLYKDKIRNTAYRFWNVGSGEWDSPVYHGHSQAAYANLYAFAQDPEVREFATAILDYLWTAGAVKYYRGAWGGPTKRDYGRRRPWGTSANMAHLFYGDSPTAPPEPDRDHIFYILSGYKPPKATVKLAQKHVDPPVELLNSHPTYQNYLPGRSREPKIHEVLFYGDTFQLGTEVSGHSYHQNGFKLLARNEDTGADYFIPSTGTGGPVTSSAGPDRIAQYRNLALWLNRESVPFQFFMQEPADAETRGDVLFLKFQKTWLAVHPLNLEWGEWENLQAPDWRDTEEKLLRAHPTDGKLRGFAVEVSDHGFHDSYEAFRTAVLDTRPIEMNGDKVTFHGSRGHSVGMAYDPSRRPTVFRNGNAHSWADHYSLYKPADGSNAPVSLGWKERTLHVRAGGYSFTGRLQPGDGYTTTQSE
jgi:hypothetical protein